MIGQQQTKTLRSKSTIFSDKYLQNGSIPSRFRQVHDIPCCILYFILFLTFVGSCTLGIKQGNLEQLLFSTGQGFICGLGPAYNFSYTYFYNPLINNKSVCVSRCPESNTQNLLEPINCYFNFKCSYNTVLTPKTQYTQQLSRLKVIGYPTFETAGKVCLPSHQILSKSLRGAAQNIYSRITEQHEKVAYYDIYNKFHWMILISGLGLLLSILFHILIRKVSLSKIMVPSFVIFLLVSLVLSGLFFNQAGIFQISQGTYKGYLGLGYIALQVRYLIAGLFFASVFIFSLIVFILEGWRIRKQIKSGWDYEQTNIPTFFYQQFAIYAIFLVLFLIHWSLCIFTFIELQSAIAKDNSQLQNKIFTQPTSSFSYQRLFAWFVVFWAIFGGFFIQGFCKTMIAIYYSQTLAQQPKQRKNKILDYFVIILYHHFGSVVAASFFIPIFGRPLQYLLWLLPKNPSLITKNNLLVCILKPISPGSYLHIAIQGKNYCQSSSQSNHFLWGYDQISERHKIQTEKIAVWVSQLIITLMGSCIVQIIFTFSLSFKSQIFEPLVILTPCWIICHGISEILLCGLEFQSIISRIHNIKSNQGAKEEIPSKSDLGRRWQSEKGQQKVIQLKEKQG